MESSKKGATTLYCMNFSGYVVYVTVFSSMRTTACCLVVGLGLDLVSPPPKWPILCWVGC